MKTDSMRNLVRVACCVFGLALMSAAASTNNTATLILPLMTASGQPSGRAITVVPVTVPVTDTTNFYWGAPLVYYSTNTVPGWGTNVAVMNLVPDTYALSVAGVPGSVTFTVGTNQVGATNWAAALSANAISYSFANFFITTNTLTIIPGVTLTNGEGGVTLSGSFVEPTIGMGLRTASTTATIGVSNIPQISVSSIAGVTHILLSSTTPIAANTDFYAPGFSAYGTPGFVGDASGATGVNPSALTGSGLVPLAALSGLGTNQLDSYVNGQLALAGSGSIFTNAATSWIDPNGTAGVRGVQSAPFPNLWSAVAAAQPGDTLIVQGVLTCPTNLLVGGLMLQNNGGVILASSGQDPGLGLILSNSTLNNLVISNLSQLDSCLSLQTNTYGAVTLNNCLYYHNDTNDGFHMGTIVGGPQIGTLAASGCTIIGTQEGVHILHLTNAHFTACSFSVTASMYSAVNFDDVSTATFDRCSFYAAGGTFNVAFLNEAATSLCTFNFCTFGVQNWHGALDMAYEQEEGNQTNYFNNCLFNLGTNATLFYGPLPGGSSYEQCYAQFNQCVYWPASTSVNFTNNGGTTVFAGSRNSYLFNGGNIMPYNVYSNNPASNAKGTFTSFTSPMPTTNTPTGGGVTNVLCSDGTNLYWFRANQLQ